MVWGNNSKSEIEFRVEFSTPKAWLIIPTNTGIEEWCPKSQTSNFTETGVELRTAMVADWWLEKTGVV